MKEFLISAMLVVVAATAQASTVVNFGPATACPTYCYGFTTDDPDVAVDWINPDYSGTLLISVNGIVYRGAVSYSVVSVISSTYPLVSIQQATDVPVFAPDGTSVLATVLLKRTTTKVNSGRAHYYLTRRYVLSGTVTLP